MGEARPETPDLEISYSESLESPSPCTYVVGNTITLELGASYDWQEVEAHITKVFEFTFSSAMVVLLNYPELGLDGQMMSKAFDQRFAKGLSKKRCTEYWDLEVEQMYHDFIWSGEAATFFARLEAIRRL